ncbi:hypothetical protein [Pseudomonas sp. DP16D-R1]|uniref:hypothetical protein n=1 Tax=Pseudomonas sp. DP16D-R1 TaxID=2075551 RepID=UPI0011AF1E90|nr:hypothetical protein [Pseudomonas sp. DP16D-R1]
MTMLNTAPKFGILSTKNQVSVYSQPNMNGSDAAPGSGTENANLASIIQSIINKGGTVLIRPSRASLIRTSPPS